MLGAVLCEVVACAPMLSDFEKLWECTFPEQRCTTKRILLKAHELVPLWKDPEIAKFVLPCCQPSSHFSAEAGFPSSLGPVDSLGFML